MSVGWDCDPFILKRLFCSKCEVFLVLTSDASFLPYHQIAKTVTHIHTGTLVYVDEQAAALGPKGKSTQVMDLRTACRKTVLSGSVCVIVAPKKADVALCDQLVSEVWSGSACVICNGEFVVSPFSPNDAPQDLLPFLQSLVTVYSFQPVAVSGLIGNQEVRVCKLFCAKQGDVQSIVDQP